MSKNIIVISTSLRNGSNSDVLADAFIKGASEAGHAVEKIQLKQKAIKFCTGCMACQKQKEGHCVMRDDADEIVGKMAKADIIVFATPIYFYEMSGQMKTLLDRCNPLFPVAYTFRDIYLLATAADEDSNAFDGALKGLEGWISCFEQSTLKGSVCAGNVDEVGAMSEQTAYLQAAYEVGKSA